MGNVKRSPWLLHYDGSSCNGCDIEVLACLTPVYDAERFGIINTGDPMQADIFLITGGINKANQEVVRQLYNQMPRPKVVVAVGVCACTGGVFKECYNIIGGAGLISNDFVSRMDLMPYLCALYIEEEHRGHNYGKLLIDRIKQDTLKFGYEYVYLCSDHVGYYEHFGFERIAIGYHPWGETSGIFRCKVNNNIKTIFEDVKAIIDKNIPLHSNLANISRLLKDGFINTSWAGFYLSNDTFDTLHLASYQGSLACTTIEFNKGVCGAAAQTKKSQLVSNVHEFEGHIACSSLSNSEVVVPIVKEGKVYGVIDLDSNLFDNYSKEDVIVLEQIANEIAKLF